MRERPCYFHCGTSPKCLLTYAILITQCGHGKPCLAQCVKHIGKSSTCPSTPWVTW